jgi:hypothetical protein
MFALLHGIMRGGGRMLKKFAGRGRGVPGVGAGGAANGLKASEVREAMEVREATDFETEQRRDYVSGPLRISSF